MNELDFSFSGLLRQRAEAVVPVTSVAAAAALLADTGGQTVNFRGAGHSFGDRCISDGGLLLLNRLCDDVVVGTDQVATIPSGLQWHEVERQLNQTGRSAPVLTNWLGATVGGTMAYGGFGVSSYRRGAQVDHVQRVELLDAQGRQRVIVPGDPDWSVVLCTAGAMGMVTSIDLGTVSYQPYLEEAWIACQDERELASKLLSLAEMRLDVEMLWAQISCEQRLIGIGRRSDVQQSILPGLLAERSVACTAELRTWENWIAAQSARTFPRSRAYLWSDYVVPASRFESVFLQAYQLAYRPDIAAYARPRIRVLIVDRKFSPRSTHELNPVNFADEELLFGIGVYLEPLFDQPDVVVSARAGLSDLLASCLEAGGRPYFATWHEIDSEQAALAYGDNWHRARAALAAGGASPLINPGNMPPL
jgi:FAD/FMN-containing dehydrogenase